MNLQEAYDKYGEDQFRCPLCDSYMFGSSDINNEITYHCHGNETWTCAFQCSQEDFETKHRYYILKIPISEVHLED